MGVLPQRFTGYRRAPSGPSRMSSMNAHRSFRLTRPGKEKMMGKAVGTYMPQNVKKDLRTLEEQIVHAAGAGKKTFTDAHGIEHKISDEMRYFAKEAREGTGHTLTRKSEVKRFAEGFVETAREENINLRSGYNIGSERDVAGKIVKEEEAGLAPVERRSHQEERREHREKMDKMRARIGLPGSSMSTGSRTPPAIVGEVQPVQPIAPGSVNAPGPTKLTSAGHPAGLASTPMMVGGRHTDIDDHANEQTMVAPPNDPITEENQTVAESIPPAKDVDLPDTSEVDKGLPF